MNFTELNRVAAVSYDVLTFPGILNSAQMLSCFVWGFAAFKTWGAAPIGAFAAANLQIVAPPFYLMRAVEYGSDLLALFTVWNVFFLNYVMFIIGLMCAQKDPQKPLQTAKWVTVTYFVVALLTLFSIMVVPTEPQSSDTIVQKAVSVLEPCVTGVFVMFFVALHGARLMSFAFHTHTWLYSTEILFLNLGFFLIVLAEKITYGKVANSSWSHTSAIAAHLGRVVYSQATFGWLCFRRRKLPALVAVESPQQP